MIPLSYSVIELTSYAMSVVLILHARKQGARWLSTILWGMAFGLTVELMIVARAGANYEYGRFFVMIGPKGKEVPLWVGMGWGFILYAATWTAQRLAQPSWLRPLSAGVLAVNLDLSLDPVAAKLGYWTWHTPGLPNFYAVPYDNFLGWFSIVASYALFVRWGFHVVRPGVKGSSFWVPPLAALLSLAVLVGVQLSAGHLYTMLGGPLVPFVLVFGSASAIAVGYAFRSRRDHPRNWPILAMPIVIHALLWFIFISTQMLEDPMQSSLLVVIPLNLAVGFFAYAWPSLDRLFPARSAVPPT